MVKLMENLALEIKSATISNEDLQKVVGGESLLDYLFTPFITKKRSK